MFNWVPCAVPLTIYPTTYLPLVIKYVSRFDCHRQKQHWRGRSMLLSSPYPLVGVRRHSHKLYAVHSICSIARCLYRHVQISLSSMTSLIDHRNVRLHTDCNFDPRVSSDLVLKHLSWINWNGFGNTSSKATHGNALSWVWPRTRQAYALACTIFLHTHSGWHCFGLLALLIKKPFNRAYLLASEIRMHLQIQMDAAGVSLSAL